MFKVNLDKVKSRLKENREQRSKKSSYNNPKDSIILKPTEEGKLLFRAVPYPHSDPGDPFVVRSYHYIEGVGFFYCPAANEASQCHVCDFTWEQMKLNKGNKDKVKEWSSFLPNMFLFIPGLARGREDEGFKFLRLRTYREQEGKNHSKVIEWFLDEETENWMDPENGFDIKITYVKNENSFIKAKFVMDDMTLSRNSTPFSDDVSDYEEFMKTVKDIDEVYEPKTTEDTLEYLKKWRGKASRKSEEEKPEGEDEGLSTKDSSSEEPESTSTAKLKEKLAKMGVV